MSVSEKTWNIYIYIYVLCNAEDISPRSKRSVIENISIYKRKL